MSTDQGYELYQYRRADGAFDYDRYREVQVAANKKKINNVWVREENIAFLAEYVKSTLGGASFGLCHGTRRGKEQEWFRKHLGCEVLGTEISDTATEFPHTIQWDFHEVKPEWVDSTDFIYSNSFDHSYDPRTCLNAWMSCVRPGGVCLIEHTSGHEEANEMDPFGAEVTRMPYLVLSWGEGRYCVTEILNAPSKPEGRGYIQYLVVKRLG
ncbi:hypothetical protein [Pseudobythopirellula maris]|uniref:hypothetical protein n=1 Tax=Pseudobythopirellula maris TaxID=2527991 RepID=UPI0011B7E738|nr:hypothetical protein [Pseudobythopirellula maris]